MNAATTTYAVPVTIDGVYAPQQDSRLLIEVMMRSGLVARRRVLDLCTGSGVVAIAAAELGAHSVTALDICPRAVQCSRSNVRAAGVDVEVAEGPWTRALGCAPFDVIVSNPPYVPTPSGAGPIPSAGGPQWSWNGGVDGRIVLDPLCEAAGRMLTRGGSLLVVQSVLANARRSVAVLRASGLHAGIIASQEIPFGPVLSAQAGWLERTGRIQRGCRTEELVVIRADKR